MRMLRISMLSLVTVAAVSLAGWAIASGTDAVEASADVATISLAQSIPADAGDTGCQSTHADDLFLTAAKKGGGKPGGNACCNPDDEPGTNGNPFCFEGASCCSDGVWRCNNPDASPSCDVGQVCDGSCGSRGDACNVAGDCCSGKCKGGKCR